MAAAWLLTVALLLGVFGGRWLDARLGTSPLFVLAGAALGMAVGFRELIRVARRPGATDSTEQDRDGD
jgi:F0F1-type ATP synthase assembly protein I